MPPAAAAALCAVCGICASRYRCPRCAARYCVAACYAAHGGACAAAAARGCTTIDGLGMLVNQGVIAVTLWTGVDVDPRVMREELARIFAG